MRESEMTLFLFVWHEKFTKTLADPAIWQKAKEKHLEKGYKGRLHFKRKKNNIWKMLPTSCSVMHESSRPNDCIFQT